MKKSEKQWRVYKIIKRWSGKEDKIFVDIVNESQMKDIKRRFANDKWIFEEVK
jgi:hypothetical protein